MPTYEYVCPGCNEQFDAFRKFADIDQPAACPECGEVGERKISAGAALIVGRQDGRDMITDAANDVGRVKAEMGFDPEVQETIRQTGREVERNQLALRRAKRDARVTPGQRQITAMARIPKLAWAYNTKNKDRNYYAGEEGIDRARGEGFGVDE